MSLVGSHVQPYCSWVPPTLVTYGETFGYETCGSGLVAVCLWARVTPTEPLSPEEEKNESPLATPLANVASNRANCVAAALALPKADSSVPKDIEKTVPPGNRS